MPAWPNTPGVADPGNALYANVVRRLLLPWGHRATEVCTAWAWWNLCRLNEEHLADVAEAALAAANAAADRQEGVVRTWRGLRGGVWGRGDMATAYLHAEIRSAICSPSPPPPPPAGSVSSGPSAGNWDTMVAAAAGGMEDDTPRSGV